MMRPFSDTALTALGDRLLRPTVTWRARSYSVFRLCGYAALAAALSLALLLALLQHLSVPAIAVIAVAAVVAFLAVACVTKAILGEERLVYYHHEIAILLAAALAVWLLGEPVLPYLDVTVMAIGAFLAVGRVGCFMVGCCHGRPHRFGVCYRHEHAMSGFTRYYVGVRLFPIQLVESAWAAGLVIAGTTLTLCGLPAGTALAWYLAGYAAARFFFEFLRGDPARSYWCGFSEAQWTSLALITVTASLELSNIVPYQPGHPIAAGLLVTIIPTVGLLRHLRRSVAHRLLCPRHVEEIAGMVEAASDRVKATSLGIRISAGRLAEEGAEIRHYTVSGARHPLTDDIAGRVANVILTVIRSAKSSELLHGGNGVYHLLVR